VLSGVADVDATSSFLERKIRLPVGLAPVGSLEKLVPGGAAAAAKGAEEFGVPLFLSSVAKPSLEEVAAAGSGPKIYQLYVRGDAGYVDDHIARVEEAGYAAFCITVDTAVYSRRERDLARRYRKYDRTTREGPFRFQALLDWKDIERVRARCKLPLILKGIATAEDALLAVKAGADVVYVSNHGGRQLDCGRGTMAMLPEILDAVAGRAKVFVDGGISRGTDVIKALAMGADLVLLGRLYAYALAAGGAPALVRMLEILEEEIVQSLGLLGVQSPGELRRAHLCAAPPVSWPGVFSAFPLIDPARL
jgi:glycolate oxidase